MYTNCLLLIFLFLIEDLCAAHVYHVYTIPLRKAKEVALEEVTTLGVSVNIDEQRENIRGRPGLGYYIEVDIGTPPQRLNVLIDTGSSNFAVAAAPHESILKHYERDESSTYQSQNTHVKVPYTQGQWSGDLGRDQVSIPSVDTSATFTANIAAITQSQEFFINGSHWQGILGLAYAEIARPDQTVTPFFDSLTEQNSVRDIFALQTCGTQTSTNATRPANTTDAPIVEVIGSMNIGGLDPALYEGPIQYTPIRHEWFYEVIMTDVKVNNASLGLDCKEYNFDKTIVDSGTTNLRLPQRVFNQTRRAIERYVLENMPVGPAVPEDFWTGGIVMCPSDSTLPYEPFYWFPTLTLDLQSTTGGQAFSLVVSPQQYLRHDYDQEEKKNCYKFGIAPSSNSAGTVIGAVILEGFYVIFDRENQRVGFAKSSCADSCINGQLCVENTPPVSEPFNITFDPTDCGYARGRRYDSTLTITAYTLAAVCLLCLLPVIGLTINHQVNQRWRGRGGRGVVNHHRLDHEPLSSTEPDTSP